MGQERYTDKKDIEEASDHLKWGGIMVTVKVFGTLRLDTGIKEIRADVKSVDSIYPLILKEARKKDPHAMIKASDVKGCLILVNGRQMNKRARLKDGDIVMLLSPMCGG